ncbi:MAG: SH3 domain-containing protein [Spirochaetia bacterium]
MSKSKLPVRQQALKLLFRVRQVGIVLTGAALLAGVFTSCGESPIGYGVLMWPEDPEYLDAGSILTLMSESNITNSYWAKYRPNDEQEASSDADSSEDKSRLLEDEFSRFRVRKFETEEAALDFAHEYGRFAGTYARSQRDALPIRRLMDRHSDRIYRLREGEELKVIDRSPEETDEAGLVDYWYQVIAEDGTTGWTFGYYLTIYEAGEEPDKQGILDGELFSNFLMQTWRPRYFADMLRTRHFDLERFHPAYGLFPQPETRSLRIVTREGTTELSYSDLQPSSESTYIDQSNGLELEFEDEATLTLRYQKDGERVSSRFVVIESDVRELISDEQTRRIELYDELYQRAGGGMQSLAYGDIDLQRDRSFFWRGNSRLRPEVIPNTAGNTGQITLGRYLHSSLQSQFDGALAFDFNGIDTDTTFLYRITNAGLQLTHVPESQLDGVAITAVPELPLVIFFAFGDGPPAEDAAELDEATGNDETSRSGDSGEDDAAE